MFGYPLLTLTGNVKMEEIKVALDARHYCFIAVLVRARQQHDRRHVDRVAEIPHCGITGRTVGRTHADDGVLILERPHLHLRIVGLVQGVLPDGSLSIARLEENIRNEERRVKEEALRAHPLVTAVCELLGGEIQRVRLDGDPT